MGLMSWIIRSIGLSLAEGSVDVQGPARLAK